MASVNKALKKTDSDKSDKKDVLADLLARREVNIKQATEWPLWEIEEELERAKIAKEGFLMRNPRHDLRIIEEHISQLEESYKIKSNIDAEF